MSLRELLLDTYAHMPAPRLLDGLSDEDALRRPDGLPHSVAEVIAHMGFWQAWFLQRIRGTAEPMAQSAAAGWPSLAAGAWPSLRDSFLEGVADAASLGDEEPRLARPLAPAIDFPPLAGYTVRDALLHVASHNAHHLGQIVTIRQLIGRWPPPAGSWTW